MQRFEGLGDGDRVPVELIGTDVERGFIDIHRLCQSRKRTEGMKADYLISPEHRCGFPEI
jgi:hypothetical protein